VSSFRGALALLQEHQSLDETFIHTTQASAQAQHYRHDFAQARQEMMSGSVFAHA
jgi:hypothetical protein